MAIALYFLIQAYSRLVSRYESTRLITVALVNVLFVIIWFSIVFAIAREHRELEAGNRPELAGH